MPFADYLSRSVALVCDSHADFDLLFRLAQMHNLQSPKILAVEVRQSQPRPSFLGKCDRRFIVECGLHKDFDFGFGGTLL